MGAQTCKDADPGESQEFQAVDATSGNPERLPSPAREGPEAADPDADPETPSGLQSAAVVVTIEGEKKEEAPAPAPEATAAAAEAPAPAPAVEMEVKEAGAGEDAEAPATQEAIPSAATPKSVSAIAKAFGSSVRSAAAKPVQARKEPASWDELLEIRKLRKEHLKETACTEPGPDGTLQYRSLRTSAQSLGGYGVGIQLYFEQMIAAGSLFCCLFFLNLPILVVCLMGGLAWQDAELTVLGSMGQILTLPTLGNLGNCERCGIDRSALEQRPLSSGSETLLRNVTPMIGIIDCISVVIILVAVFVFIHWWIPRQVQAQDDLLVTAADYAVEVENLPRRLPGEEHATYEKKLGDHFRGIVSKLGDFDLGGSDPIHEVTLIREYDGAISSFFAMGELHKGSRSNEVGAALIRSKAEGETDAKKKEKLVKQADKLEEQAKKMTEKIAKYDDSLKAQGDMADTDREVCFAIVMFKSEHIKESVLAKYNNGGICMNAATKKELRFCDRKIKVTQVCEPADLYWENLDFHPLQRLRRKIVIILFTIVLIVITAILVIGLSSLKLKESTEGVTPMRTYVLQPQVDECVKLCTWEMSTSQSCGANVVPADVQSVFDGRGSVGKALIGTVANSAPCVAPVWTSPACTGSTISGANNYVGVNLKKQIGASCTRITQTAGQKSAGFNLYQCAEHAKSNCTGTFPDDCCTRLMDVYSEDLNLVLADKLCKGTLSSQSAFWNKEALDQSGRKTGEDVAIGCFCTAQVMENGPSWAFGESKEAELCKDFFSAQAYYLGIKILAILAVLVINQVILIVFYFADAWVRHRTQTSLSEAAMVKLFLALFINTGVLGLLLFADFHGALQAIPIIGQIRSRDGPYDDFTPAWFGEAGVNLLLTILGQLASSTISAPVQSFIVNPLLLRFFGSSLYTEHALYEMHRHPPWPYALRQGQTLMVFFVVIMYSGGMPLLYLVGAFYCFLSYWIDKITLLRGSEVPPAYNKDVVDSSMGWLIWAVFLHVVITAWMYGQQAMVPSDWSALQGMVEGIFGTPSEPYDDIMKAWQLGSIDGDNFPTYIRARFLDLGRTAAAPLTLLIFAFFVYVLINGGLFIKSMLVQKVPDDLGKNSKATRNSLRKHVQEGSSRNIFSYAMKANHRYAGAYEALVKAALPEEEEEEEQQAEMKKKSSVLGSLFS